MATIAFKYEPLEKQLPELEIHSAEFNSAEDFDHHKFKAFMAHKKRSQYIWGSAFLVNELLFAVYSASTTEDIERKELKQWFLLNSHMNQGHK